MKKFQFINRYAKPYTLKFIVLFLCIVITVLIGAVFPYIFGRLIDVIFYEKDLHLFFFVIEIYVFLFLVNQVFHFILNMNWAYLMTDFLFDIKEDIFKKVLSLKGQYLADMHSGDIIKRMSDDTEQIMELIHWNIFYAAGGIVNLGISIFFLFYINWGIALYSILITPVVVYSSRYFSRLSKRYHAENLKENGLLSSWVFEILKGMQEVKLLNAAGNVVCDYIGRTVKIIRIRIKVDRVEVFSERVNSGIQTLAQICLYGFAAVFIINGQMSIGEFTACIAYFAKCIGVFNSLNDKTMNISANMASIDRVAELFNEEEEDSTGDLTASEICNASVEFRDVSFSYEKAKTVLKEVSFKVEANRKISIVGASGTGKSTLVNLIYRLYEPERGEILIDGKPLSEYNLYRLRDQIGIVHQDSPVFDGSIRYNISYQADCNQDELIWNALRMVNLHEFVSSMKDGLDTCLGNGGIGMSGGQRQRLSIARALVKNPAILIFDEATSSLDGETESIVTDCWDVLSKNCTILIIAHRLTTIQSSDAILVLSDGKVVGFDKHDRLLAKCEPYKQIFREQYEGVTDYG
ncbi:ABC transporter ATP-binding protein [Clostridium sp. E02]|uniref:ABC transporter ATP-binding protein n=1 Tax=Clostridium sp. E02 TaxID=2487134 RepID=UPI000F5320A0|nr:ABC transporter ATP-binding protein [Clostridium sp. E02]